MPDAPMSARFRSLRLCSAVAICLSVLVSARFGAAQELRVDFDIPSQPLSLALDKFGNISGLQIFYETILTEGRRSPELKGAFDRETALGILLQGSELTARIIAPNTITVTRLESISNELRRAKQASVSYYGSMQAEIMRALCQSAETRPGYYQATMQYWIGASGRITRFKLIRSSGAPERDEAIGHAMQSIVFQPPLRILPQPVTLAIEPIPLPDSAGCTPNDRSETVRVR
jgi:TonB family protein